MTEQVKRLIMALSAGLLSPALFVSVLVSLVLAMRQRAAIEAEAKLCKELDLEPRGLWLKDMSETFEKSFTTTLDESGTDGIADLVEAIETESKQRATTKAMRVHKIERYQFIAGPDACDKCKEDDGKIYPVTKSPSHHRHCKCEARPIENDEATEND